MPKLAIITVAFLCAAAAAQKPAPWKPAAKPESKAENKPATVPAHASALPSETLVNAFMKRMFGYEPLLSFRVAEIKPSPLPDIAEVVVIMSSPQGQQSSRFYVAAGERYALVGDMIPFGADPFAPARAELARRATGPVKGLAAAKITVVEFSDLQCPHCKQAQPTIDRLLDDVPDVRFQFEQYPLPSHDWAMKAAQYADCLGRESKDAFWKYVALVYDHQSEINLQNSDEKLKAYVTEASGDAVSVSACAAQPEAANRVKDAIALGKAIDVTGTPTLFINGRKIGNLGSLPYETLKSLVQFEISQAK
ncbi:MAG TPA: thioredoxin domain-containing protein [Burkholderiales bacterium]|nr:thioredoxin domain-containing protein [Burkholderiales bacterium]